MRAPSSSVANLAVLVATTTTALILVTGCPDSSSGGSSNPAASTPPGAPPPGSNTPNPPGTPPPADVLKSLTVNDWLGVFEVRIEETPDPGDPMVSVAASGLAVNPPTTTEERATHQALLDEYRLRNVDVPKGSCVPRRTYPTTSGTPRYADVGEPKISKDGLEFLLLNRLGEGNLQNAQKTAPPDPMTFGLALKYWIHRTATDPELGFGAIRKPAYTSAPALDENGNAALTTTIDWLLQFSAQEQRNVVTQATLSTVNPNGPFYECYADDAGKITVPASILLEFSNAIGTGDAFVEYKQIATGAWPIRSGEGAPVPLAPEEPFDYLTYQVSWGGAFLFHF